MKIEKTGIILSIAFLCVSLLNFSGCSVVMAAKQPDKKDVSVLKPGTPRDYVIAELGNPISSEMRDGDRVEIYSFTQGYHTATKAGRALFHGAADVFTFGIWEAVGTPSEAVFNGSEISVRVTYDKNNEVKQAVALKGKLPQAVQSAQPKVETKEEPSKTIQATEKEIVKLPAKGETVVSTQPTVAEGIAKSEPPVVPVGQESTAKTNTGTPVAPVVATPAK